ncbi:MAG TPA: mechanosensitive ion channel domain-containing protein, partial [Rhizomicrobium sp.]
MHKVLALAPDWLIATLVLILTIAAAAALFNLLRVILHAALKSEQKLLQAIVQRAGRLAQFAFILLAAALVVPALPLDRGATDILHRILIAAFIVLLGWIAVLASDLAIERYVGRFKLDVEDNLMARKTITQMRMLKRIGEVLIGLVTAAFALMTFDTVREYGISLFASAGIAGLAVGLAARPLLGNLIAGVQLAITQPIRLDDAVVVEGEWGRIEEFTSTYVVIRLWDSRRLIVPLSYFLEHPFQNWTRTSSSILGSAIFHLDYTADIGRIRARFEEIVKAAKQWDGRVANMQVTDISERSIM